MIRPSYRTGWTRQGFHTLCEPNSSYHWFANFEKITYDPVDNRYAAEDVVYAVNSQGFRCEEFDPRDSDTLRVVTMGCSNTFGIGLPQHEVWPYLLNRKLRDKFGPNVPFWNVAEGGRSTDWCARIAQHAIPLLKPDIVIALVPQQSRREITDENGDIFMWVPQFSVEKKESIETIFDNDFTELEFIRSLLLIHETCRLYGAKFFWSEWINRDRSLEGYPQSLIDAKLTSYFDHSLAFGQARDKRHSGPATHIDFADQVFRELLPVFEGTARI